MIAAVVAFVLALMALAPAPSETRAPHADYDAELNHVRAGLAPVSYSANLTRLAQMRADEIASEQQVKLNHGSGLISGTAENLWRSNWSPEAWQVIEDWLASPSHDAVMRSPSARTAGWGFAQDARGWWYVALLLGEK